MCTYKKSLIDVTFEYDRGRILYFYSRPTVKERCRYIQFPQGYTTVYSREVVGDEGCRLLSEWCIVTFRRHPAVYKYSYIRRWDVLLWCAHIVWCTSFPGFFWPTIHITSTYSLASCASERLPHTHDCPVRWWAPTMLAIPYTTSMATSGLSCV